ncbi:MAG: hypothetical protein IJJ06_09600 [Mogibacterium sp.]|nr:hypothetical protein [Mogibacterium sp.]
MRVRIVAVILSVVLVLPMPVFAVGGTPSKGHGVTFDDSAYRTLRNRSVRAKKIKKVELRTLIKENSDGYSVVQGGCTDGKYAYYLMVSSYTQNGRILKVNLKNHKVVKRSKVLNTWHGNGMAYDSKRKKLVVIAREHRKQEITIIDARTLRVSRQEDVKYDYFELAGKDSLTGTHQRQGLAAIAYVKRYDCYVALERTYKNLLFFDPVTFEAIGMAYTDIMEDYPGTYQAMDADDKYVYLLLSYYSKGGEVQPYNRILALDWNSENLLPVVNGELLYVPEAWSCNNNGSGKPDAVIRVKTNHEAENIYHTTDKKGREHFYMSEYYGRYAYKKVKVNGKRKKQLYFKRSGYVYDLGII